jgi:hypothetical protein
VREIERRVQKAGQQLSDDLDIPAAPTGVPKDVEEHITLMYDLQVLAWQAEITRVSTFLMCKELSGQVYPKSGIRDPFHTLSHHSNVQENKDRFTQLNQYHVKLFTHFLGKLKATPDGDGTLLDHSLVLYGSGMSDGNSHNHTDLPVVLAGGASGKLKGGRHIQNPKDTPMANLLLSMLETLQVPTDHFGDSSGRVAHLEASPKRRRLRLPAPVLRHVENHPREQIHARFDGTQVDVLAFVGVRAGADRAEPLTTWRLGLERRERRVGAAPFGPIEHAQAAARSTRRRCAAWAAIARDAGDASSGGRRRSSTTLTRVSGISLRVMRSLEPRLEHVPVAYSEHARVGGGFGRCRDDVASGPGTGHRPVQRRAGLRVRQIPHLQNLVRQLVEGVCVRRPARCRRATTGP